MLWLRLESWSDIWVLAWEQYMGLWPTPYGSSGGNLGFGPLGTVLGPSAHPSLGALRGVQLGLRLNNIVEGGGGNVCYGNCLPLALLVFASKLAAHPTLGALRALQLGPHPNKIPKLSKHI